MKEQRVQGFVVGSKKTDDRTIWKVRVKQEGHPLHDEKLVVFSTHENVGLASGLDVSFLIGSIKNNPVAVDVKLELMSFETQQPATKTVTEIEKPRTLNLMITEVEGDIFANFVGAESEDEAKSHLDGDEQLVAFFQFEVGGEFDTGALDALTGLIGLHSEYEESICQQLERIITELVKAFARNQ